jgi:hypothetical protein
MKMKVHDYDEMLKAELKDPKFRKEYEAIEEEFEVAKQVKARIPESRRNETQKNRLMKQPATMVCFHRRHRSNDRESHARWNPCAC